MPEEIIAPVLGTPEYDAAMALKAEQTMNPPADRPAELPDKFKTIGDLANAYAELEKKQSQATPPVVPPEAAKADPLAKPPDAANAAKADPAKTAEDAAKAAVADAGLDFNAYSQEFAANEGKLSDESYKALADGGIPRALVDSYIAGQREIATSLETAAYTAVGGQEEYSKMTEWAAVNMSESEVAAFNKGTTGSKDDLLLAVSGLRDRYRSANGIAPTLLQGGAKGGSSSGGFQSNAEMTAAMKSPLYQKDPAYRKQVEAKIAASTY